MEKITEQEEKMLKTFCNKVRVCNKINTELFAQYQVKRGLRDIDGKGVLVGLTEIGEVRSYNVEGDKMIPIPGRLIYRGIDISDIVNGFLGKDYFGFEETCYLLLLENFLQRRN